MSCLVFSSIYTDPAFVANSYKSSEQTLYPASNAYNIDKRLKTWRSGGYFNITSGSNTLVFRESVGVDLTATVTAAEYSTDATFLAALKSALDAAGASTYTVARDTTTNRIKITSNGAGGGGIFQLMCTDGASAAMCGVLGYSTASNRTGALVYEADLLRIHTNEYLLWDLGIPTNPTGFFAVANRNVPINISGTATVKLQANWTNDFSSPAVDLTVTVRDFILSKINTDGLADIANGYRYWRVLFTDTDNADGYIELGAVMLGKHTTITRGCPAFPFPTELQDRSNVVYSEGGQTIVGRRSKTQVFTLDWQLLDKSSLEALESDFNYFGLHSSFFLAFDPNSAFSTDGETWTRLVKFNSNPTMTLRSPGNWSMQWQVREEL